MSLRTIMIFPNFYNMEVIDNIQVDLANLENLTILSMLQDMKLFADKSR